MSASAMDVDLGKDGDSWDDVHHHFRAIVAEALKTSVTGFGGLSQLAAVSSGRHSTNDRDSGDQFIFMLPYAGTFIKWRLLFCAEYRNYPPDFLCLTEDFYYDPEIYTKIMQSWDYNDKNCLANLLKQLLSVYKDYQLEQLKDLPHVQKQYDTLLQMGIADEELEIFCNSLTKKVNIIIKLAIEPKDLPVLHGETNYGYLYAALLVTYGSSGSILSCNLSISPYLSNLLEGTKPLKLRNLDASGVLDRQYLDQLAKEINHALSVISENHVRRRHVVAALLNNYQPCILDYDRYMYLRIDLLFHYCDIRCVVRVILHENDQEIVTITPDRWVRSGDGEVNYCETSQLFLEEPGTEQFAELMHSVLTSKLKQFACNAMAVSHPY